MFLQVVLGGVLILTAAACAENPEAPAGGARKVSVSEAVFAHSRMEVEFLESRAQESAAKCMINLGFTLAVPQVEPIDYSSATIVDTPSPLLLEDAAIWGYQESQARTDIARDLAPNSRLSTHERELFDTALSGSAGDVEVSVQLSQGTYSAGQVGCLAEARVAVFGSVENFLRSYYGIAESQVAVMEIDDDPNLVHALETWVECMLNMGHHFHSPADAAASFDQHGGSVASTAEIETALADASCREESALHEAYDDAARNAVRDWMERNGAQVAEAVDLVRLAMENQGGSGVGDGDEG